ncbi:MAG: hypothetical protein QXO80_05830 [Thermosphaera sp.]
MIHTRFTACKGLSTPPTPLEAVSASLAYNLGASLLLTDLVKTLLYRSLGRV